MRCPFCNTDDTKVTDSRLVLDGSSVRRRRECVQCQERFTTFETVEYSMPRVIKRNGSREAFNEDKLRSSFLISLRKRPVSTEQSDAAINKVIATARATGEREIPSSLIGELIMEQLRKIDHVAFVRFASVYRDFKDLNEFITEIDRLK